MTVFPSGYSFERIFPDAGEFEERHRAAGLHRWYFASADGTPATKAAEGLEGIPGILRAEKEPVSNPDAIPFNDPNYNMYHEIHELPQHLFAEMSHFFTVYKSLENKQTAVNDEVGGREDAIAIIKEAIENYIDTYCK